MAQGNTATPLLVLGLYWHRSGHSWLPPQELQQQSRPSPDTGWMVLSQSPGTEEWLQQPIRMILSGRGKGSAQLQADVITGYCWPFGNCPLLPCEKNPQRSFHGTGQVPCPWMALGIKLRIDVLKCPQSPSLYFTVWGQWIIRGECQQNPRSLLRQQVLMQFFTTTYK